MSGFSDDGLITVQDFANLYGVTTTTVRWWISKGYVQYELVGPRKMVRKSSAVVPLDDEEEVTRGKV